MLAVLHLPLALSSLLAGLVLLPTPLPVGLPLIVASIALLVGANESARRRLRELRGRFRWLDTRLYRIETRVRSRVRSLAEPLRVTRVPHRFRARRRRTLREENDRDD